MTKQLFPGLVKLHAFPGERCIQNLRFSFKQLSQTDRFTFPGRETMTNRNRLFKGDTPDTFSP